MTMTHLEDAVTTQLPASTPKSTSLSDQREATLPVWSAGTVETGVWECEPGVFTTARNGSHEICQILAGSATLTGEDGQVVRLVPGSIVVLPDGWKGSWRVHESLRKTYVIVHVSRDDADNVRLAAKRLP
ncbi:MULTISPECIES: cupin domain-containing protein [Amycolatopsis]|uniref:(S)-ureidoglycine aminohydrolase cupin domain-containing protein n=1 Tax=Amycolatopsis echigonensis TaxID=2576905 RepID=A0A2N3WNP1_9PSEU|nr:MULTISPECIES: cupin domain-containing protein [Amycolatopsis]PKV95486.1 hypothetical protein ATK30_6408 [Amycolatopsis niigatensis]